MRALSASNLLDIWERGAGRAPVEQALAILHPAFPQASMEMLARLDIVQRDHCLLHLRVLTFGSQIKGVSDCPACAQRLEMDFDARELPAWDSRLPNFESSETLNAESSIHVGDYRVTFRLPNSLDLSALTTVTGIQSRHHQLVEACLVAVQHGDTSLATGDLPATVLDVLVEQISRDHPLADLTLPVTCPSCGHMWEILFDIVSYFWSEIQAWSMRLMREVHTLASVYGWREVDILEMSAWRRQRYLELIGVQ